jgi:hypothetical protein
MKVVELEVNLVDLDQRNVEQDVLFLGPDRAVLEFVVLIFLLGNRATAARALPGTAAVRGRSTTRRAARTATG